jgi:hypothetical protein
VGKAIKILATSTRLASSLTNSEAEICNAGTSRYVATMTDKSRQFGILLVATLVCLLRSNYARIR